MGPDENEIRPGFYLEGKEIDDIRSHVAEMIVQDAEAIKTVWQELYENICAASGVFAKWITDVAAQIEAKHELETPCAGRHATTGRRSTDTGTPRKRGPTRSTKRRSWSGIGRRSCKCCD